MEEETATTEDKIIDFFYRPVGASADAVEASDSSWLQE